MAMKAWWQTVLTNTTCKAFTISWICTLCRPVHMYSAFRIVSQVVNGKRGGSFLLKEKKKAKQCIYKYPVLEYNKTPV